jgi:signal transduction histidine kinase
MKRSFKVRIFLHVILISAAVIVSNRLTAQYFLTDQLQTRIHQEMGVALETCENHFQDSDGFLSCFKALEKGSLFSNISDFYVLCDRTKNNPNSSALSACQPLLKDGEFWRSDAVLTQGQMEFSHGSIGSQSWYAVRFKDRSKGAEVWLQGAEIDALMLRVWALRDRNTIYVLPTILATLLALTLYLTYVVMRPITSIQNTMAKLTANTLDQSIVLQAPFKEFETLVKVFDELRVRLNDSFTKARRFASDASHELRTPLTILRGNVERLIHDLPMGSDAQIRMRSVSDEVERLIEITEKLLLLSRADANSLGRDSVDVNLSDLLTRLIKDAHSFQSSLKITSAIAPNVIWRCDQTLVHQLVQNLYANAVHYNQSPGWIHFCLTQAEGRFQLTIENPAKNIPADLSERAFDRFYRGDASHTRQVDGLGLGLSICLEIVKLHKATLSLTVTDKQTVIATVSAPLSPSV